MATIKDIANAAGVSVATVSHVVNNTRFVSPELRKRVEEAIANAETPPNFVVKKKMQEKERKKNKMLMEEQKAIVADAGPEFYLYLTSSPFAHFDSSVEQELRKLAGEQGCELVRVSIESEGMLEFLTCSLINSSKMKGIFVTASVATEKLSEILNSVSVPVVIWKEASDPACIRLDFVGDICLDENWCTGKTAKNHNHDILTWFF